MGPVELLVTSTDLFFPRSQVSRETETKKKQKQEITKGFKYFMLIQYKLALLNPSLFPKKMKERKIYVNA